MHEKMSISYKYIKSLFPFLKDMAKKKAILSNGFL